MATIESWGGNMLDIGPMYPFVGTETILYAIGLGAWIIWHIWQLSIESAEYKHEQEICKGLLLEKRLTEE